VNFIVEGIDSDVGVESLGHELERLPSAEVIDA
jgi:hypothetical protein